MKHGDRWTIVILVVLVVVLAAISIRSVVSEQRRVNQKEQLRDGRE